MTGSLPNLLTLLRISLIPVLVFLFYLPFDWARDVAALIFAIAAATDWLDGFLARYLNQTSAFGAFLDPVADKLIVAVALVLLVSDRHLHFITIPACIIVGREIAISALREWMAEIGKRASVAVNYVSKSKTAVQMVAITILLLNPSHTSKIVSVCGYISLYVAAILTLWTMIMYLKAAWPELHWDSD